MVRQWQEFFFEKRYASTYMPTPDFVKIADAYGTPSRLVTDVSKIKEAITFAKETPGPVLIEFLVEKEEVVQVKATDNSSQVRRRGRRPQIEEYTGQSARRKAVSPSLFRRHF